MEREDESEFSRWPTELLQKLIQKEQKNEQLQCELQTAYKVRTQLQSELKTLRVWFDSNDQTVASLRNFLSKKNEELEELKVQHDESILRNDHHVNALQRQLTALIENTHAAEERVKLAHTVQAHSTTDDERSVSKVTGQVLADPEAERTVVVLVLRHLDVRSRLRCARVCHLWCQAVRSSVVWDSVTLAHEEVTNKFLSTIASYCTQSRYLTLKHLKFTFEVEHKNGEKGSLEVGLEKLLQQMHQSLETIAIIDCGNIITNRFLWLVSCYCQKLKSLSYVSDTDPAGGESLWSLGCGCRLLDTLIIPPLHSSTIPGNFTNHSLYIISEAFTNLKVLCIGGPEIDVRGLSSIAKRCEKLHELELDHVGEIREKTAVTVCHFGFRALRVIAFTYTPVTPKALLHFYRSCTNLQMIRVCLELSTYYPNPKDHTSPNRKRYADNIEHIKVLQNRSNLCEILIIAAE